MRRLAKPDQEVVLIGDAVRAGKARDAIDSAFRAALLANSDSKVHEVKGTTPRKGEG